MILDEKILDWKSTGLVFQRFAGAFALEPPPAKTKRSQCAHHGDYGQGVVRHHFDGAGAQFEDQQGKDQPAHHSAAEDRDHEGEELLRQHGGRK